MWRRDAERRRGDTRLALAGGDAAGERDAARQPPAASQKSAADDGARAWSPPRRRLPMATSLAFLYSTMALYTNGIRPSIIATDRPIDGLDTLLAS